MILGGHGNGMKCLKMASKGKVAKTKSSTGTSSVNSDRFERKSAKFRDEGKTKGLAFKILSSTQTKELAELETVEEIEGKLADAMKLSENAVDSKEAALLDYYTAAFWWGKEQGFTVEQLSAFFTVIHTLLENIKEKQMGVVENLKEFKNMLIGVGKSPNLENSEAPETPTGGLDCMDVLQAKAIGDYVYVSLFQHYKLYEYVFSHTQAEEIVGTDLIIEVPKPAEMPWPPPLDDGVTEEVYLSHIATPPPTPVPPSEEAEKQPQESVGTDAEEAVSMGDGTSLSEEDAEKEANLLAQLTTDEVKTIVQSVIENMAGGLQAEVAQRLREMESTYLNRINKVYVMAEKPQ